MRGGWAIRAERRRGCYSLIMPPGPVYMCLVLTPVCLSVSVWTTGVSGAMPSCHHEHIAVQRGVPPCHHRCHIDLFPAYFQAFIPSLHPLTPTTPTNSLERGCPKSVESRLRVFIQPVSSKEQYETGIEL